MCDYYTEKDIINIFISITRKQPYFVSTALRFFVGFPKYKFFMKLLEDQELNKIKEETLRLAFENEKKQEAIKAKELEDKFNKKIQDILGNSPTEKQLAVCKSKNIYELKRALVDGVFTREQAELLLSGKEPVIGLGTSDLILSEVPKSYHKYKQDGYERVSQYNVSTTNGDKKIISDGFNVCHGLVIRIQTEEETKYIFMHVVGDLSDKQEEIISELFSDTSGAGPEIRAIFVLGSLSMFPKEIVNRFQLNGALVRTMTSVTGFTHWEMEFSAKEDRIYITDGYSRREFSAFLS